MAHNHYLGHNPRFEMPVAINQEINYVFSPSVLVQDHPNILSDQMDGVYENFNQSNPSDNAYRPTLKEDIINPPKYNGNRYLEFGQDDFLESNLITIRRNRKYKELTFS